MIRGIAFKHVEVLNYELLILVPPYPKPLLLVVVAETLLNLTSVKQVKNFLIVDL
jgi:hypothetical protein